MPLANVNSPLGFKLYRASKPGVHRTFRTAGTGRTKDLMVGDAYMDAGNSDGTIIRAVANSDTILGFVEGFIVNPIAASPQGPVSQDYIPAADAGSVIGIEDKDAEFEVQADDTTVEFIGSTMGLVDADGSQLFRQSRQAVATAGTQFVVTDLLNRADNTQGVDAKVVVRLA